MLDDNSNRMMIKIIKIISWLLLFQAKPKPTFMEWYKEIQSDLKEDNSDLTPAELTKLAMSKYKQLFPAESKTYTNGSSDNTPNNTGKRKSNDKQSGIAKLAKFNFSK